MNELKVLLKKGNFVMPVLLNIWPWKLFSWCAYLNPDRTHFVSHIPVLAKYLYWKIWLTHLIYSRFYFFFFNWSLKTKYCLPLRLKNMPQAFKVIFIKEFWHGLLIAVLLKKICCIFRLLFRMGWPPLPLWFWVVWS